MATNYDVLFLRLAVQNGIAQRAQALQCLQAIDTAAQQGRSLNAAQAVLELGLVTRPDAEQIHGLVSQRFEQSGEILATVDAGLAQAEVSGESEARPATHTSAQIRFFDLAQTGEGLEGYELGPLLGHGVAGSCYMGRRQADRAKVVVKTLHPRFQEHPALLKEVQHELRCWLGFRHEGAASTLAVGTSHGHTVVVSEYAEGQSLDEYIKEHGPLRSDLAMAVMLDLCDVVASAHGKGLYLGDIRSRKLYYDGSRARLTDLGLSRASCLAAGYAQYGLPFGHPSYLAPEVLQEGQTRAKPTSDVYAMGILFYELICGYPPYQGDVTQTLEQHLDAPLPPPPEDVTFSTAMAGVILRMTAKAVDQRVHDVSHLREAIHKLSLGQPFRLEVGPRQGPPVDTVSRHDWEEGATRAAVKRRKGKWSETVIRKAPVIGPSDIGPTHSTLGGVLMGQVSGRLPAGLVAQIKAEAEAEVQAAPGRVECKIGEKVGRGTVGASYEGTVRGMEAEGPLVLKVVSRKYAKHQEIMDSILDDMRAAKGFKHPNVVPILDVFNAGGRDVVVMPRVAGKTLRKLLEEQGKLPLQQAVALINDLVSALEAAQERGLAHGDLRPEKIYVDGGGVARLADFGHSKAACLGAGLGKEGLYFGHPIYLAPEVLQDRSKDPNFKTDVYSLGIVFYEVLCGRPPFKGREHKETLLMHLKDKLPPPPRDVAMPQPVANTIMRMTAKDPAQRYGSAAELKAGLQQCLEVSAHSGEHPAAVSASGTSGPLAVDEFDPLEMSNVSEARGQWAERSQVTGKPKTLWSKDKLKKAQKKGGPTTFAGDELGALYDDLKAASGDKLMALGVGNKAPRDKGKGKKDKAKKPKKKGGPKDAKVNQKQLMMTGGGLVAVLVVIVVLMILKPGSGPEPRVTKTGKPKGVKVKTSDDGGKKTVEISKRKEAIDEAVADYEDRVKDLIQKEKYKEALALKNEVFDEKWRGEDAVKTVIREQEATLHTKAAARFKRAKKAVERLITADQLGRAKRRVKRIKAWAVDPVSLKLLEEYVNRLASKERAELEKLGKVFKLQFDEARAKGRLTKRLRGWGSGGRLFRGGGLILAYDRADRALKSDVRILRGKKQNVGYSKAPSGEQGIHIKSTRRPVIVVLNLKLRYVIEAMVRFVVAAEPSPEANVALVAGIKKNSSTACGVAWGTIPVRLVSSGIRPMVGASQPKVRARRTMMMRFKAPAPRGSALTTLAGWLIDGTTHKKTPGSTAQISVRDLQGKIGVYVANAEVWVTGLKVKGLLEQ